MSIAIPNATDTPQTDSLADINHAMQSAAESDTHHEDIHSAVVGGDFGGRDSNSRIPQDFIPDRQIAQLRIPPHSIEAESSVLGGLLLDNAAWDRVGDLLNDSDFYRYEHRLIYSAMTTLINASKPADVITVYEQLQNLGKSEEVGGLSYLNSLAQYVPSASNIRRYAEIVRERAILRKLVSVSDEIATNAFNTQGRPVATIVDEAEQKIFNIGEEGSRMKQGFQSMDTLVVDLLDRVQEMADNPNDITGVPTGFYDLDRLGLSDPAMEEALEDIPMYWQFAQLDPGITRLPDETAILRFRHLLETNDLSLQIMATINALLTQRGLLLKTGTVVDATLIAAPSSTKNKDHARDPEMHSSKKGNQMYFGMKAHIGADAESGIQWHIAMRPGKRKALNKDNEADALIDKAEKLKAGIRAKVEHPFRVVKRQFGFMKVRYRGLKKNTAQLITLFALSNLWMVREKLIGAGA